LQECTNALPAAGHKFLVNKLGMRDIKGPQSWFSIGMQSNGDRDRGYYKVPTSIGRAILLAFNSLFPFNSKKKRVEKESALGSLASAP
jgi:hypothetical protein